MLFDAHFHYSVCAERKLLENSSLVGLSCAHSFSEWELQAGGPNSVFKAFGIHPQLVGELSKNGKVQEYLDFLDSLASTGKLNAIGEMGFDFFTDDFKFWQGQQKVVWENQLEIALKYNLPIVVHCRKANDKLFQYSSILKKLPAVLFHSFMGSLVEAESLIKRNINCFFSFGKQMMNNNKKVIDCVINLPIENLLFETDAPFQTLKGENDTYPSDIKKIYNEGFNLRKKGCTLENDNYDIFCNLIFKNAKKLITAIQI